METGDLARPEEPPAADLTQSLPPPGRSNEVTPRLLAGCGALLVLALVLGVWAIRQHGPHVVTVAAAATQRPAPTHDHGPPATTVATGAAPKGDERAAAHLLQQRDLPAGWNASGSDPGDLSMFPNTSSCRSFPGAPHAVSSASITYTTAAGSSIQSSVETYAHPRGPYADVKDADLASCLDRLAEGIRKAFSGGQPGGQVTKVTRLEHRLLDFGHTMEIRVQWAVTIEGTTLPSYVDQFAFDDGARSASVTLSSPRPLPASLETSVVAAARRRLGQG